MEGVVWYFGDCYRRSTWGWFVANGIWFASESSMRAAFPVGTVFVMDLMGTKPVFKARREAAAAA